MLRIRQGIHAAEGGGPGVERGHGAAGRMARLLEGQAVTVAEYEDLFGLLLRSCDLGLLPPSLDAVVLLASAGKMRLDAPGMCLCWGWQREFLPLRGRTAC